MVEDIVQMGPMLILAGLIAGWVAEVVSRADGHGFIRDMVLGLAGSVVVGATVWFRISSEAGMPTMFLIGCGGAALAILAQRRFWPSATRPVGSAGEAEKRAMDDFTPTRVLLSPPTRTPNG